MKTRIVSTITAAVLLLTIFASCAKPTAPLTAAELLDLGEKYLLELDYELALVQFLAVIEIEPMNPRGYTGSAEAYIGLGDTDKAIAVLRQGLEQLPDDAELLAKLDELEIPMPTPEPTPEPTTDPVSELPPEPQITLTAEELAMLVTSENPLIHLGRSAAIFFKVQQRQNLHQKLTPPRWDDGGDIWIFVHRH
jgi:tetratricopeptide (TPR) repeat protein